MLKHRATSTRRFRRFGKLDITQDDFHEKDWRAIVTMMHSRRKIPEPESRKRSRSWCAEFVVPSARLEQERWTVLREEQRQAIGECRTLR
jgi:hypothetical protein